MGIDSGVVCALEGRSIAVHMMSWRTTFTTAILRWRIVMPGNSHPQLQVQLANISLWGYWCFIDCKIQSASLPRTDHVYNLASCHPPRAFCGVLKFNWINYRTSNRTTHTSPWLLCRYFRFTLYAVLSVDGRLAPRDPLIHGYPWIGLDWID